MIRRARGPRSVCTGSFGAHGIGVGVPMMAVYVPAMAACRGAAGSFVAASSLIRPAYPVTMNPSPQIDGGQPIPSLRSSCLLQRGYLPAWLSLAAWLNCRQACLGKCSLGGQRRLLADVSL